MSEAVTERARLSERVELAVGLETFLQSDEGKLFIKRVEDIRTNMMELCASVNPSDLQEATWAHIQFQSVNLVQQVLADLISEGNAAHETLQQMDYED